METTIKVNNPLYVSQPKEQLETIEEEQLEEEQLDVEESKEQSKEEQLDVEIPKEEEPTQLNDNALCAVISGACCCLFCCFGGIIGAV